MRRLYLSPRTLSATRPVAYRAMLVTAVLALTCWLALPVMGQSTTGTLTGLVTDPQGAIVSGATVTLINSETRVELKSTSNDQGEFVFPQVTPGRYSLGVEATNFKKALATDLVVEVGVTSRTTVVLEVGSVTEQVTITATQDIVNSSSPTLTSVINTRQVQDLPLPTRNPLDLAGLQPGVAVTGTDNRGSSISGLRQTSVHLTQDGINAMDNFVKTSSLFAITAPSLNSTSEFSITTGTNDSGSGRGVGQVRLVTRGGTNDFHGDVFYLNRNDYFQANSFFNNTSNTKRPRQNQHFFGFTLGGPMFGPGFGEGGPMIWNGRDRAFWFFSYEGFRENFSATRNRTVLTQQARNGIFRYTSCVRTDARPECPTTAQTLSVNLLTIGNANLLNAVTMAQLNAMPLPNNDQAGDVLNTAGFRYNVTGKDVNDKYVFRYDHVLVQDSAAGSHKLEFVFNRATFNLTPDTFNSIEAPFPGGIDVFQASTRSLATIALHSTFGNVTNELRYGRQWAPVNFLRAAPPDKPFFTTFAAVTNFDNVQMGQGRETIVTQWIDNMAIPMGSHTIRLGADFQQVFADTFNDAGIHPNVTLGSNSANSNGVTAADFALLPSGATGTAIVTRASNVFADLTGFLGSAAATFNVNSPTSGFVPGATRSRIFKQRDLALYVQDQWRAKPNLSISLGLRWDYQGVPTIPNGLAIQVTNPNDIFGISGPGNLFNPTAPVGAAPAKATLDFVSGDTGKGLWNNDWNNFAPFFGFAYSPDFKSGFLAKVFGPTGTSSFRGGYSISYLHDGFTVVSNALGTGTTNPGLIQTSANTTPTGVLSPSGVALTTPSFTMPITDRQNFLLNPNNALWAINPDLRIPYVQQWSFGYEREITRNMAFEIRYAANHGVKVWRANNFNEINIFENGFLREFQNAQRNRLARGGDSATSFAPGCAGCVPTPLLDKFFGGLAAASGYTNATFLQNLAQNNVGTMANTLAFSTTYRGNRENPINNLPANFFAANPNAAGITLLGNDSFSNYHSLQAEIRRRFSGGLQFQADYTFSKSMTDAPGALGNNQSDLTSFRTLRDKHLDYMRSAQDQTHRFVFNSIYDLPFGRGRRYLSNANGFVDRVLGGWTAGSIVVWATRPPWFIASNRATVNQFNAANNPADLVGMSFEEFKKNIGVFRHATGIYFINPELLNITTTAAGTQSTAKAGLFASPAAGFFGNFPMNSLNGPRYFNIDASLVKRIPITERVKAELKTTFINILNNPNFSYGGQNFDSTSFGRITATSGSPRVIHFTFKASW